MAEDRRHRRVDGDDLHRTGADARQDIDQAVEIHRLRQHVAHHLADERVIGNADVSLDVLLTGRHVGEDGGEQIVGEETLDLNRHLAAVSEPRQRQRARGGPAPARAEDRRGQRGLFEHGPRRRRLQVAEDVGEREAVLFGQRDVDAVVGRGRLQLEVEGPAEPLTQRQSPRPVHACAERRMDDELHAAAFVEEPLGDDGLAGRHGPEDRAAGDDELDGLLGAGAVEAAGVHQPVDGRPAGGGLAGRPRRRAARPLVDLAPDQAHPFGELVGPARCLAAPERDGRGLAVCVFDQHTAGARHAPNAPRRVAEQHHVAGHALDGEVLVDGPDDRAVGLRDDGVEPGVGNRAAVGDGRQSRAAACAQRRVDLVAVQERREPAAPRRDS